MYYNNTEEGYVEYANDQYTVMLLIKSRNPGPYIIVYHFL